MDPTIRNVVCESVVPGTRLKVMTYNVLSQGSVNRKQFPTNGKAVKFAYRFPAFITEFRKYNPDVLCLQEVDAAKFQQRLKTELQKLGYDSIFKSHPTKAHGLMIAWKKEQWYLNSTRLMGFEESPSPTQQVRSNNIALFVLLSSKTDSHVRNIWVGTTHLYWHPDADFERARQMLVIRDTAQLLSSEDTRVIVAGDFNSTPDSAAYALATGKPFNDKQRRDLEESASTPEFNLLIQQENRVSVPILTQIQDSKHEVDVLTAKASTEKPVFKSCYALKSDILPPDAVVDGQPLFTNWTDWFKATIDHVFVLDTPDLVVNGLLETPSAAEMGPEPNSLPRDNADCRYPSDHIALMADLTFAARDSLQPKPSWGLYLSGLGAKIMHWATR